MRLSSRTNPIIYANLHIFAAGRYASSRDDAWMRAKIEKDAHLRSTYVAAARFNHHAYLRSLSGEIP